MPNRTRRNWLRVIGTTGVIGIAGCSSSEETEPDEGQETARETETDEEETILGDSGETLLRNPTQQAKLAADDGDDSYLFGFSVTLSSDGATALIGAAGDEDPNGGVGSAYVFE